MPAFGKICEGQGTMGDHGSQRVASGGANDKKDSELDDDGGALVSIGPARFSKLSSRETSNGTDISVHSGACS